MYHYFFDFYWVLAHKSFGIVKLFLFISSKFTYNSYLNKFLVNNLSNLMISSLKIFIMYLVRLKASSRQFHRYMYQPERYKRGCHEEIQLVINNG